MPAYSPDLRERVIGAACEALMTQPEIAATFAVSLSSVEAWTRTFRETGRTAPLPYTPGRKRVLKPYAEIIHKVVAQQPDATLAELCQCVATKTGVLAQPNMMCRELQVLKLPQKKVVARQSTRNRARPEVAGGVSRQDRGNPAGHRRPPKIHR